MGGGSNCRLEDVFFLNFFFWGGGGGGGGGGGAGGLNVNGRFL